MKSSRNSARRLARRLLVLAVVAVAGCKACDRGHPYPPEVIDNFVASCRASASESACRCTVERMRRLYTYEEFQTVERRLQAGDVPPEVSEIIAACSGR